MTVSLFILALGYAFVLGKLHERMVSAEYGARADVSALGWWYRKPEFRDWLHEDQECIEAGDFRPLQGICMAQHFKRGSLGRDLRPMKLEIHQPWSSTGDKPSPLQQGRLPRVRG